MNVHVLTKLANHRGVDLVGLFQKAMAFGKVSNLSGVGDANGYCGLVHSVDECLLATSGRFADH